MLISNAKRLAWLLLLVAAMPSAAVSAGSYFAVIVSDIEASTQWYQETFGLTTLTRFDAAGDFEIVNLGKLGMYVELLWVESAAEKPAGRTEGLFKAGMLVDDLDAFVASLPTRQSPPEIVTDTRNRLRLVQLRDPDDNVIQVMELQEPAPP